MIREQAITHQLTITKVGERVAFQIRLPHDTRRIIGLEYEVRTASGEYIPYVSRDHFDSLGDTDFFRNRNRLIGRLSLRNDRCEGLFYQGNLIEDRNTGQHEGIYAQLSSPQPWIQSRKREEIGLSVAGRLIEGLYEDGLYGLYEYDELQYELYLYLWIEKCVP
jgi:hypothetical protein